MNRKRHDFADLARIDCDLIVGDKTSQTSYPPNLNCSSICPTVYSVMCVFDKNLTLFPKPTLMRFKNLYRLGVDMINNPNGLSTLLTEFNRFRGSGTCSQMLLNTMMSKYSLSKGGW